MAIIDARGNGEHTKRALWPALAAVGIVSMIACGSGDVGTGSQTDDLLVDQTTTWSGVPPLIHVCFEASMPTPPLGSQRAVTRAHAEAWQRVARVNFTGWDDCVAGKRGIHVAGPLGGGSWSLIGRNLDGVTDGMKLDLMDSLNAIHFRNVVLHQFGTALGFLDEEARVDYVPSPLDLNGSGFPDNNEFAGNNSAGAVAVRTACAKAISPIGSPRFAGSYDINSVMSRCGSVCFPGTNCENTNTELSPNDVAAIQTFYGRRISGQLVTPQGDCAAAPTNDADRSVFVWDCDEFDDDQEFRFTPTIGTLHIQSGIPARPTWCMESTTVGSTGPVSMYQACDGFPGQAWRLESVELRGWGGLCMDLEEGDTAGGLVRLFTCGGAGGVRQKWSITRQSEIKFGSTTSSRCLDVNAKGRFIVTACTGSLAQKFNFSGGRITRQANGQCVDAQAPFTATYAPVNGTPGSGLPANGTPIQQFSCIAGQLNQFWNTSGPVVHDATGSCLERLGGSSENGTIIQRASCNGSAAQTWDFYL